MAKKGQSIHDAVAEKMQLADTYARDGAFLSAARVIREAADMYEAHFYRVSRPTRKTKVQLDVGS